MTDLFQHGQFKLSSRLPSNFRIECDALSDASIEAIAQMVSVKLWQPASHIISVPNGGDRLAGALIRLKGGIGNAGGHFLIVEDVGTTFRSMERIRLECPEPVRGLCIFARGPVPPWVTAIWQWSMSE